MLEQYLRQIQGEPGPKVRVEPPPALRAPTSKELLASKRKKTGFIHKPPAGTYKKSKFVPGLRVKEDAGAQLAMGAGLAAGAVATALIAWAHKKYMDWYGKANQACGKMKGSEGKLCRQNYKVQAAKAEIQALKFARSKCRRSKDPKVCVQTLNKKIRDLMDKHPDIEYTMKAIAKHKQESYDLNEFFGKKETKSMIGIIKNYSQEIYNQCKKANKGRYNNYDLKVICLEAKALWTIKGIKNCKQDTNPEKCKKVIQDYIEDLKMEYTSAEHEAFRQSGGSYFKHKR